MIETKQYSLSKKEYTKIVLLKRLNKSWWLYLLIILFGFVHLQSFGENDFSTFFTIFCFAYPFLIFTYLYFWAYSKDHEPVFSKTFLKFDDEYLYFTQGKNETKLDPNSIQKIVSRNNYWMLYISKGQFIYLPKNIFYSEEDLKKFKALIRAQ